MEHSPHSTERRRPRSDEAEPPSAAGSEATPLAETAEQRDERVRQAEDRLRIELQHELHPAERGTPPVGASSGQADAAQTGTGADALLAAVEQQSATRPRRRNAPALPAVVVTKKQLNGLYLVLGGLGLLIVYLLVSGR